MTTQQPTPTVTFEDVERILRRDFPDEDFDVVWGVLEGYGVEENQREPYRVRAAVLKLAEGSLESLSRQIELARIDYRDVLAAAEYPRYSRFGFEVNSLPAEKVERIIAEDWKHYRKWLEG